MRSYKKLSIKYLKSQKSRSLYTILGIALAVTLIATIGIMGKSIETAITNDLENTLGSYHGQLSAIDLSEVNILKNNINVEEVGIRRDVGIIEIQEEDALISIGGADEKTNALFHRKLISGNLPCNPGEIALDKWALKLLKHDPIIGSRLTLNIESSYIKGGKKISESIEREFVLTGIFETRYLDKERRVAYGQVEMDSIGDLLPPNMPEIYTAFYTVKEESDLDKKVSEVAADLNLTYKATYNGSLIVQLEKSSETNWVVVFLGIFVSLTAAISIYNIIQISVLERIRDFGLLRAAGASTSQVRKIVYREAAILSLIGIPIGLVLSCFLSLIIIRVSGSSILNVGMAEATVTPGVLIGASLLGCFSVFISTLGPAREASRVSPIEAIKNYGNPLIKDKGGKKRGFIGNFFGITGQLAYQNMWRNRKRTLITLISLSLSVILFIVFGYFVKSMDIDKLAKSSVRSDFTIQSEWTAKTGPQEDTVEKMQAVPGVEKVIAASHRIVAAIMSPDEINDPKLLEMFVTGPHAQRPEEETDLYPVQSDFFGYNATGISSLKNLVVEGAIIETELKNGSSVVITRADSEAFSLEVGDEVIIRNFFLDSGNVRGEQNRKFKVAAIVEKIPSSMYGRSPGLQFMTYMETIEEIFYNTRPTKTGEIIVNAPYHYSYIDISVDKENDPQVIEAGLREAVSGFSSITVRSYTEERKKLQESKRQFTIMIYGMIVVIALIAAFSIINTINTNLIIRKKEFGTLRAIGLTNEQLKKMIVLEGTLYGIMSAFWGTLLGSVFARVLYPIMQEEMGYLTWSIPWIPILIAGVSCIALGIMATLSPIRRISKMNIVDSIRTIE